MESKKLIVGIGIIAVISAAVAFLRHPAEPVPTTPTPKPITVGVRSVADSRSTKLDLGFPGVVSTEGIATITAKVAGTVVSSGIRLGQKVGVGTVLARIDDPAGSVSTTSGYRNADIRAAELSVERAALSVKEEKRLDQKADTHASEFSKDLAKKNLESAQAVLASLLDLHTVKSPIAGIVTDSAVTTSDTVNQGVALFTVKNGSAMRNVTFFVSEAERGVLIPGQKVRFSRSAGDNKTVDGTLRQVASVADPSSRRFLAEASVSDPAAVLPGTSVSVLIEAPLTSSVPGQLFLPLSALTVESSGTSALFQNDNGKARRVEVSIVRIEGEIALVSADLPDDAEVIIENAKRVKDGDPIETTDSMNR